MNRITLLALALVINSSHSLAAEFDRKDIQLVLPKDFEERKIADDVDGLTTYQLTQHFGSGSPEEVIEVFLHIRDIAENSVIQKMLKEKGASRVSELSLAVAVRNSAENPNFKVLGSPQFLNVSHKKAMTIPITYSASYATRAWSTGMARVTIYCIAEPTRTIEFQVMGLSDGPQDLFSSTIKAIENARFTSQ